MRHIVKLLIIISIVDFLGSCYHQANSEAEINAFLQIYSQMPLIHAYYNRHFRNSRQFEDFKDVISQVEYETSKYAKIIFTDCDQLPKNDNPQICEQLKKTIDNRAIIGTFPSNQFTNFGSKAIQSPPRTKGMSHHSDIYTYDQIVNFIHEMMPHFYRTINNLQQYEAFMNPKYVPKLLFFWNEEDPNTIPFIVKKISVQYYLRFDFGFIEDLNSQIMKKIGIQKAPALIVIKFDFAKQRIIIHQYTGRYTSQDYDKIALFLQPLALKQPRNDFIFHKIKMITGNDIQTIETKGQLYEAQQRASGWVIIQTNKNSKPQKIDQLKQKYGDYFQYIHFRDPQLEQGVQLQVFSPIMHRSFGIENGVQFLSLNYEDFWRNATLWLNKDYVLLAVRQQYSHLCALAEKTLFRGIVQCAIAKEEDYKRISETTGSDFKVGIVTYKQYRNSEQMIGNLLDSAEYEQAYKKLEYNMRMKVKQIMDKMKQKPIDQVQFTSNFFDLCAYPTKKCAIFVSDATKKLNTKKDYLQQIALQFANQYRFYHIDPACNPTFAQEISKIYETFDQKGDTLVVFHPLKESWTIMRKKMTKGGMKKFLKESFNEPDKLGLIKVQNRKIIVRKCQDLKVQENMEEAQQL